jgi:hypothetical protein
MFRKIKRKRLIAGIIVALLALAGGAIAYWSASGSAEGEYTKAKSATTNFEVTNTESGELVPGGASEPKAKVKDTEASGFEHIKKLTAKIEAVTNSGSLVEAEGGSKCYVGWFKIEKVNGVSGTSDEPGENIEHGTTKEYPVEVKMLEEAAKNQNGCKGVKLTLKYSVE